MKNINTDRRLRLTMFQRVLLSSLLSQQTPAKLGAALGRPICDDDMVALYSVLRKTRCESSELTPFQRMFGSEKTIDMDLLRASDGVSQFILDGFECRTLKAFLSGWLSKEGALGDRDWCVPVINGCE